MNVRAINECDVLVVGSGPGGSTTACLLAEAGLDVLLVEEGSRYALGEIEQFSLEEIEYKYRNGGLTPTFGRTNVTYIEGRCVGGGSEVNAALCHMPPESLLDNWRQRYGIEAFGMRELEPYFTELRRELTVSGFPFDLDPASLKLQEGADNLGWANEEIERFWRYPEDANREQKGRQQTMTETMLPRAERAGCRIQANTRVKRLRIKNATAQWAEAVVTDSNRQRTRLRIHFRRIFLCAGPVQTPLILQRSGIGGKTGKGFTLHPMIRVAVRYNDIVNDYTYGVPVQQVVEFKPEITLGCSHSSLPHLAMWLSGNVEERQRKLRDWRKMAVFYVLVMGSGRGMVRNFPAFNEAFVTYPINDRDMSNLGKGLFRLAKLLFSTGAVEIFNPIANGRAFTRLQDLEPYRNRLPQGKMTVSTIHLFSSCPMGGDATSAVVDSWGRLYGFRNIRINDASILPAPTGVNPQATLMAIARRNVRHFFD